MQKISSYLLNNRVELVADLAGFITEWKPVYKRHIRVYRGIDNTLEFDIKNADQKRIDLSTFTSIKMNVMDNQGYALPNSPYAITPLSGAPLKGMATVTIPAEDLADLTEQALTYSVVVDDNMLLYADARFGATGTIDLITNAIPITKPIETYDRFLGTGDFNNTTLTYYSDAVNLRFRDAVPPNHVHITVDITNFIGSIWVEATKDEVIGNEAFTYKGTKLFNQDFTSATSAPLTFRIDIAPENYTYIRLNWTVNPHLIHNGKVNNFTVEYHTHAFDIPC